MNNELTHYGILGMKWGVRKRQPESGMTRRKVRKIEKKRLRSTGLKAKVSTLILPEKITIKPLPSFIKR